MKKKPNPQNAAGDENGKVYGDPIYSDKDDIYSRQKKESLNEDIFPGEKKERMENSLSEGLDVPGSELDDANELIGEEDEENNYYSLGGDDHNDLEEDKSEE